ncbi:MULTISPECIES: DUF3426 domain-containing protein [unclassified Paraburkholderia]|uniref:DUF3426 domain-containing protein n=1 Tax=unclassified Paraburkholderia TaxID=2615204 RepID=UPI002AB1A3B9|nr:MULTISPECIES: DUF3426 domain-containing protein [unclassified Paraburkholderia]
MLLATRCPFCETVFRIQPAQLAVRRGLVRCGHCQEAFDASGSLYDMPENGDFALATPVAADIAASLTSQHAAQAAAAQHAVNEAPVDVPAEVQTEVPVDVRTESSVETAAHAAEPVAPQVEAASEATPEANREPTLAPASPARPPNFSNPIWDPWAPLPDSHLDPKLQYNAEHLPQASLAAAAVAKSQAAREVEMRVIHDDEPTLSAALSAAPATASEIDTPAEPFPPATRWTRSEPELVPPEPVAPARAHAGAEPTLSSNETIRTQGNDPEPQLRRAVTAPAFTALEPNDGAEPFAVTREAPARAKRHTGWRIFGWLLALVLIALLATQLIWWQRESVMVYWPASQPLYQQACAQLGCHVSPPRDIDGLQVQPSDLRQVDDPHHLELKVPLRNRFQVALAYPAIELTLLDRQNNVVLRRVLFPQDYAPPGTRVDAGLAAHTTQTMIVRLDTGNVVASNFRIEIFYP